MINFDPVNSLLSFVFGKAVDKVIKQLQGDELTKSLKIVMKEYQIDIRKKFNDFHWDSLFYKCFEKTVGYKRQELIKQVQQDRCIPEIDLLYDALLERWREVKANGFYPHLPSFFHISEEDAKVYIDRLSQQLHPVFIHDNNLVLGTILNLLEQQEKRNQRYRPSEHIETPDFLQPPFRSRFAESYDDLEIVLRLRHDYFGHNVICPDASYHDCWDINKFCMKLVFCSGCRPRPIGYWSLFPISQETYRGFIKNGGSHATMLSSKVLDWTAPTAESIYLYIVGIVVPESSGLGLGMESGRAVLDMFSFANYLLDRFNIAGICGYPTETGGRGIFDLLKGFRKTSVLIDNIPDQPVFVSEGSDIDILKKEMGSCVKKYAPYIPVWEGEDQLKFDQKLVRANVN